VLRAQAAAKGRLTSVTSAGTLESDRRVAYTEVCALLKQMLQVGTALTTDGH
jgi:hypothetical protein